MVTILLLLYRHDGFQCFEMYSVSYFRSSFCVFKKEHTENLWSDDFGMKDIVLLQRKHILYVSLFVVIFLFLFIVHWTSTYLLKIVCVWASLHLHNASFCIMMDVINIYLIVISVRQGYGRWLVFFLCSIIKVKAFYTTHENAPRMKQTTTQNPMLDGPGSRSGGFGNHWNPKLSIFVFLLTPSDYYAEFVLKEDSFLVKFILFAMNFFPLFASNLNKPKIFFVKPPLCVPCVYYNEIV